MHFSWFFYANLSTVQQSCAYALNTEHRIHLTATIKKLAAAHQKQVSTLVSPGVEKS